MKLPSIPFSFVNAACFLALLSTLAIGCQAANPSPAVPSPSETASLERTLEPTPAASVPSSARTPLRVFCAGSLILPFAQLETAFESRYPEVDVLNECHGSIQVIRHVTELHEPIDLVATADHALIPMLMYSTNDPQSGRPYASWYVRFASNRLALAYSPRSQFADEINSEKWTEVLMRPGVKVGLADPRFDASGYRALMALKLGEGLYGQADLLDEFIRDQFQIPVTVFEEDDTTEISVPEILEPKSGARIVVRGASIQLIALLQSGDLDYAFEYESVIQQHGLKWISLPDEINLGSQEQSERYHHVQVKLDFQRFASLKPVFNGEQIGYGITIPSNAPHPQLAEQYLAFLLSPEGRQVMANSYHPLLDLVECDQPENMPANIQSLCPAAGIH